MTQAEGRRQFQGGWGVVLMGYHEQSGFVICLSWKKALSGSSVS